MDSKILNEFSKIANELKQMDNNSFNKLLNKHSKGKYARILNSAKIALPTSNFLIKK